MMMFVLSLFAGKQIQQQPIDAVHHDTYSVAALADGMAYYQAQAIQKCWQDGSSSCAAGAVSLENRTGSQTAGGVVIPARDNEVVSVRFASSPVQGQPVIYSTIETATPLEHNL